VLDYGFPGIAARRTWVERQDWAIPIIPFRKVLVQRKQQDLRNADVIQW